MTDFVHLHCHSEHSLLDGMSTPEEIAEIVSSNGQIASAITDHGSMAGILRFQNACDKMGIKSLLGVEAYFVPSIDEDVQDKRERFHVVLIAKNDEGLYKIFKTQQNAWGKNFYYKPRIEWKDLEYLSNDVVVLSGCMASLLCRTLENGGNIEDAGRIVERYKNIFKDDFYIEVQPWNPLNLNNNLISIADAFDIPVVGTIDCHYPKHEDKPLEEVLLMVGQMPSLNAESSRIAKQHSHCALGEIDVLNVVNEMYPNRSLRFDHNDNFIMSTDEVVKWFNHAGVTRDIYSSTMEVADKCTAKLKTKRSLLPKFSKHFESDTYLREIAELGLKEKCPDEPIYWDRLYAELATVAELKFSDYFLIVWDICSFADREGIERGPGRGSVGGSLLAYCLGITDVDPIKYGLLFTRFLNKERRDYPDIDLDFEDKRRGEINTYIANRWGEDRVASISTYGQFKAKSVIKNISSVFQIPFKEMNELTQKFQDISELKRIPDGRNFMKTYPYIVPMAERLENRIRTAGTHAAGIVISSQPLTKVCPIETRSEKTAEGRIKVTAFDMDQIQEVGLIKFDILGLKALAVVGDCIKKIKEEEGIDVTAVSKSVDDPVVFERFNSDNLLGIFQAEGAGYKNLIADMGIDNFNDLVASNALVRPGALLTQGAEYIACKKGKTPKYPNDILRPILEETYGTFIYQEQLMNAVVLLADFSWSEADALRKIIGKKRDSTEFDQYQDKFLVNAVKYLTLQEAQKMWMNFEMSSLYMFNKSHAVGYSILAYQTMWLKHYYPKYFIWACLSNEDKSEEIASFLMEAERYDISILDPDVNLSDVNFTLEKGGIRFGLSNIAHCGPAAIKEIMAKRPYESYDQFVNVVRKAAVKKTLLENLEKIGAFKSLGHDGGFDSKEYYLEVLNCSIHADADGRYKNILSGCAEVREDNGIFLVRALVKKVTRKPNYVRVELGDASGSLAVFADREMPIKAKDYIIAAVGDKTLWSYIYVSDLDYDSDMKKFLNYFSVEQAQAIPSDYIEYEDLRKPSMGVFYSVGMRKFKTKTGKIMGKMWVFDIKTKKFIGYTIFSPTISKVKENLWTKYVAKINTQKRIIEDIIIYDEYAIIKEKQKERNANN